MAMARILAVTWDGGGNVPPLLGVTTRLRERGHHVRVPGHAQQRAAVESSGAEFVAYRHARPWSADQTRLERPVGGQPLRDVHRDRPGDRRRRRARWAGRTRTSCSSTPCAWPRFTPPSPIRTFRPSR